MSQEAADPFEAALQTRRMIREWLWSIYVEERKSLEQEIKMFHRLITNHPEMFHRTHLCHRMEQHQKLEQFMTRMRHD